jgi:predicted outer membrane repeat protein
VAAGCGLVSSLLVIGADSASASDGTFYAAVVGTGTLCVSTAPCSLTEALSLAPDGAIVDLAAGTYEPASSSSFIISTSITLRPTQTGSTVVLQGNGNSVVLVESSATATVSDMTVEGGDYIQAGGIENQGNLTVVDSNITDNTSSDFGGGIATDGTLSLIGSTISDNRATANGGGIEIGAGSAIIADSTIADNTSSDGGGISSWVGTT